MCVWCAAWWDTYITHVCLMCVSLMWHAHEMCVWCACLHVWRLTAGCDIHTLSLHAHQSADSDVMWLQTLMWSDCRLSQSAVSLQTCRQAHHIRVCRLMCVQTEYVYVTTYIHDSCTHIHLIYVTWLIYTYMAHASYTYMWHYSCTYICELTHTYMWHDSYTRICDMTHISPHHVPCR